MRFFRLVLVGTAPLLMLAGAGACDDLVGIHDLQPPDARQTTGNEAGADVRSDATTPTKDASTGIPEAESAPPGDSGDDGDLTDGTLETNDDEEGLNGESSVPADAGADSDASSPPEGDVEGGPELDDGGANGTVSP